MGFLEHNKCKFELVINHIDLNKKNNNLKNLEIVTQRYNSNFKIYNFNKSSKYNGVRKINQYKWRASIRIKNKSIHLYFGNCELKAAYIYNLSVKNIDKYNGDVKCFRNYIKSIANV